MFVGISTFDSAAADISVGDGLTLTCVVDVKSATTYAIDWEKDGVKLTEGTSDQQYNISTIQQLYSIATLQHYNFYTTHP